MSEPETSKLAHLDGNESIGPEASLKLLLDFVESNNLNPTEVLFSAIALASDVSEQPPEILLVAIALQIQGSSFGGGAIDVLGSLEDFRMIREEEEAAQEPDER